MELKMKRSLTISTVVLLLAVTPVHAATTINVDAIANSSSGGVGAVTGVNLTNGQIFTVSTSLTDLWTSGQLPRWSNANGLISNLTATGIDESGLPAGTLIGQNFGAWTQDGLSAPFGALVGRIGGISQLLGANFAGPAWNTGALTLFYWDSNAGDNGGSISVDVSAVPEPSAWAHLILGFASIGAALRRRGVVGSSLALATP